MRKLSVALLACEDKINHLVNDYFSKRSTLSDANNRRSQAVFADFFRLAKRCKAQSLEWEEEGWIDNPYADAKQRRHSLLG